MIMNKIRVMKFCSSSNETMVVFNYDMTSYIVNITSFLAVEEVLSFYNSFKCLNVMRALTLQLIVFCYKYQLMEL